MIEMKIFQDFFIFFSFFLLQHYIQALGFTLLALYYFFFETLKARKIVL